MFDNVFYLWSLWFIESRMVVKKMYKKWNVLNTYSDTKPFCFYILPIPQKFMKDFLLSSSVTWFSKHAAVMSECVCLWMYADRQNLHSRGYAVTHCLRQCYCSQPQYIDQLILLILFWSSVRGTPRLLISRPLHPGIFISFTFNDLVSNPWMKRIGAGV